jgi:hypothetical protein
MQSNTPETRFSILNCLIREKRRSVQSAIPLHSINQILSRTESKFRTPNGGPCTSKTIGLLVRRHIVAGEFHYIGKEASTRRTAETRSSLLPCER